MTAVRTRRRRPALFGTIIGTAAGLGLSAVCLTAAQGADDAIPSLVGTWTGDNNTISDLKGLKTWSKTIHITEQTDRRFRGYFTYSAGTKYFFGVIHPDNETVTWVASDSKGYNHGRLIGPDRLGACYVESGAEATAGCADMERVSKTPEPAPARP